MVSQKLHLISPEQLLTQILNQRDLTVDEKIKKYNILLQQYLQLQKQKQVEHKELTLTLPEEHQNIEETKEEMDAVFNDVRRNMHPCFQNNTDEKY